MKLPKRASSLASTKAVNAESEAIEAEGLAIGQLVDVSHCSLLIVTHEPQSCSFCTFRRLAATLRTLFAETLDRSIPIP